MSYVGNPKDIDNIDLPLVDGEIYGLHLLVRFFVGLKNPTLFCRLTCAIIAGLDGLFSAILAMYNSASGA
jgi:hypothetical protein